MIPHKVMMASPQRPVDVWVIGRRGTGSANGAVVLFKPKGGTWQHMFSGGGSTVGSGGTGIGAMLRGVRNPADPPGVISVRHNGPTGNLSFIGAIGSAGRVAAEFNANNIKVVARSTDYGATWSAIGAVGTARHTLFGAYDLCRPDYVNDGGSVISVNEGAFRPESEAIGGLIYSPAPGTVAIFGRRYTQPTTFQPNKGGLPYDEYEADFGLLVSVNGGSLQFVGNPELPWHRRETQLGTPGSDPIGGNAGSNNLPEGLDDIEPRYVNDVPTHTTIALGKYVERDLGGTTERLLITAGASGWSPDTTPLTEPQACAWTRGLYLLGGLNSSGNRRILTSLDADSWSTVYSGSSGDLGPATMKNKQKWVMGGLGYSADAGANWTAIGQSFTKVAWLGDRFYAVNGDDVYTSKNGTTWTAEALPSIPGGVPITFNDVFGG